MFPLFFGVQSYKEFSNVEQKIVLAAAATAMIFTLSTGHAAKPGKGDGGGDGTGGGDGSGDGHTHGDLNALIDELRLELLQEIAEIPQGPAGADGKDGVDLNESNCSVSLDLEPYDAGKLLSQRVQNGSSASLAVARCDLAYTRIGAHCLSNGVNGLLRVAGTNYKNAVLECRATQGSSDPTQEVGIQSYPICVKADLVCN